MMRWLALLGAMPGLWAAEPKRPRIPGFANVGVYVNDIHRARAFYKDRLGFEEIALKRRPGGPDMMAVIKINDLQYFELTAESPRQDGQRKLMGLRTESAEAMRAYLASRGVTVPPAVKSDRLGNTVFNIQDPDGHQIEFVEYAPGSLSARFAGKLMPAARAGASIAHVGILVRDLEAASRFYRDLLGFRGGSGDKLRVPDGEEMLELGLNRKEASPGRLNIKNHTCLAAADVTLLAAALKAEEHVTSNGRRVANLYDPDGSRIEFMEPK